jgi:hypothetical protein
MRRLFPSDECTRAREWVSLRVDGQLSEFEEMLLDAHLDRCAECQTVAVAVTGLTAALRAAPLEEPAFAFRAPRRDRTRVALRAVSAAAVVAVVGLSGLVSLQLSSSRTRPGASSAERKVIGLKEQQMNELTQIATRARPVRQGLEAARLVTVAPEPAQSPAPQAVPGGVSAQ